MNCSSAVRSELASYKLTRQLRAPLEHCDTALASGTQDEEEPVKEEPISSIYRFLFYFRKTPTVSLPNAVVLLAPFLAGR